jgi:uncharacterized repeat protein (TIGR02543 family)
MTIKDLFALTAWGQGGAVRRAMMTLLVILLTTATTAWADTVTLTAESGEVTLQDGDVLTGTGGVGTHIKIAARATVTLSGVDIYTVVRYDETRYLWPAINCQGDAVIILADGTNNRVKSNSPWHPGIYIAQGHTLTIRGKGSLKASNSGAGAGIGAGNKMPCGNIRIEDGNITAEGDGEVIIEDNIFHISADAAGIGGCGGGDCGDITITGGTVTAYGADGAAAIGGGCDSKCGNITIPSGVTYVRAHHLGNSPYAIGPGKNGTCGTVTIGGETGYITEDPYVYAPTDVPYTVTFNANDGTDATTTQGFYSNTPQALTANPFTRTDNYVFLGWNTKPDGSGGEYADGAVVNNLGNATLYAQWHAPFYVKFDANGGTGTMADQTFVWNTPQALTANTFTRTGYDFKGWNTKADGSGTNYTDGQTITNLEDMTLYAQWLIHTYTITYNLNGGTNASSNPATYTIMSDAITLAEPTRWGYIFDGWTYDEQDEPTKAVTIVHGSLGDKIFTAHWTPTTVELTPDVGYYKLVNGHTLTGTGGANTHITIADGATVTLRGVTITDIARDNNHLWAGISCEGNATIILAEGTTNTVKGGYGSFPGVTVPSGKTLTIRGSGTLIAGSKVNDAGIGSGYRNCGNIVIEGGTIIATGGEGAAGIGSGKNASCGNITITDGVTSVTATAGTGAPYSIGSGSNSSVGTVTIGGVVTGSIPQSPFTYNPSDTTPYTVTFDANGGEGSMDAQEFVSNTPQALTANSFTCTNYEFDGWNTAANGSGYAYREGQTIVNLGNVTLYAQWKPTLITKTLNSNTGYVELGDGDVVSGTGGRNTHVTIADGATVTLYNVKITNISGSEWAGITCKGNANIIVKGSNAVEGANYSAGIFVPSGKTLTIMGDGSLTATGKTNSAGIGGTYDYKKTIGINCGNIVIDGGSIIAIGGYYAAGIGGGNDGSCGDITITGGVTRVSATILDFGNPSFIGKGDGGSVGTITIAPELIDVTSGYTRTLTAPATAPTITTQPVDLELTVGYDNGHGLGIEATAAAGHTLSYQWYTNTTNSTENGTPIDGATDAIYIIQTGKAIGTTEYYYCVVTATRSSDGFTATATSDVATVTVICPEWAGSGTEGNPYVITIAEQLDLLAERVNGSEGSYASAWYELGEDISFDHGTAYNEQNFDGIGLYDDEAKVYRSFNGHFDGRGYTISGIRLYKGDEEEEDEDGNTIYVNSYKGLFGWIGSGAEVKNVTLRDARITGHTAVGGIAGLNSGTVSDCYVGSDVIIHALAEDASDHGGIAGYNMGTVTGCVSAATVSIDDGSTFNYTNGPAGCQYYGGIVGYNDNDGTLSCNLALGVTVSATNNDNYGAVSGSNGGTLEQNYYSGCNVDDDNAVPALRDAADNSDAIDLLAAIPATLDLGWGAGKYPVQLAGRTLYKDGKWNTLCLPFSIELDGSLLDGNNVDVRTLISSEFEDETLTLTFSEKGAVTTIEAGKPYIIKWTKPSGYDGHEADYDLASPTFTGVTVSNATAPVESQYVDFIGTTSPVTLAANDNTVLYLGNGNKLYWPSDDRTIGAFRAYFKLKNGLEADNDPDSDNGQGSNTGVRAFSLNFGDDDATGIISTTNFTNYTNSAGAGWYDLSGRKLSDKPTQKGVYIYNGKKRVIK